MKLPNGDRAVVDQRKLTGYCLNETHRDGRHKARVFRSALGLTADDADELIVALLAAARNDEATAAESDGHGQRYVVDFILKRGELQAAIRSAWIVRPDEDFPRLASCYIVGR